jgi:hypothetical protein
MEAESVYTVYWRKSNRHNWLFVGMALMSDPLELFRHVYISQTASEWEVGFTVEEYTGICPDNKPKNYKMTIPPRITKEIKAAAIRFYEFGITPINPQIMGAFIALHLLDPIQEQSA